MYYFYNPLMNPFINSYPNGQDFRHQTTYPNRIKTNIKANHVNPVKAGFSKEEATAIALLLGIDFSKNKFDLNEFWMGVNVELEHGRRDSRTNVTRDDPLLTGKIAWAHLNEFPDYYKRLKVLEDEAKAYWKK
ncbi:MAG: DUF5661 family protein [Bacillota bacterium]|nr:DUF5661 family protein [Bacillota bacterium]